jgi:hypothetical protein
MELAEAKSAVKAVYLQAASLAGLEVSPDSPERLAQLVADAFTKVKAKRRPEAVANALRVIAATLDVAQKSGTKTLHESDVEAGKQRVCPVYPFGNRK